MRVGNFLSWFVVIINITLLPYYYYFIYLLTARACDRRRVSCILYKKKKPFGKGVSAQGLFQCKRLRIHSTYYAIACQHHGDD